MMILKLLLMPLKRLCLANKAFLSQMTYWQLGIGNSQKSLTITNAQLPKILN